MKLWQGWHNTDLGRSYFHYGPLGGTKKQLGILAQTCEKRGVKMHGEKSGKWKSASRKEVMCLEWFNLLGSKAVLRPLWDLHFRV